MCPEPDGALDRARMVPMDLDVPAGVRSVIITGPNTGGKTVPAERGDRKLTPRTVGLALSQL